jgi:hypothetical protein
VRDYKAFFERVILVLNSGKNKLKNAQVQSNFLEEISKIKTEYKAIYPIEQWMSANNMDLLTKWQSNEGRKTLLEKDLEDRKNLNRIRGQGHDAIWSPEKS